MTPFLLPWFERCLRIMVRASPGVRHGAQKDFQVHTKKKRKAHSADSIENCPLLPSRLHMTVTVPAGHFSERWEFGTSPQPEEQRISMDEEVYGLSPRSEPQTLLPSWARVASWLRTGHRRAGTEPIGRRLVFETRRQSWLCANPRRCCCPRPNAQASALSPA